MMPDTLAHKLSDMNVPPYIVRLVIDFLTNRQQCVKYQNSQSSTKPTRVGVPQGTILGPVLWNVYVTDLGKNRQVVKYADDTTIIDTVLKANVTTTHKTGRERQITITDNTIQSAANEAVLWCENTNQRINANKTQYMTTQRSSVTIYKHQRRNCSAKLLGVTIDQHLTFSSHTKSVVDKTRSAVHGLLTLKRHGVSTASLIKFYQARITPILTYAAPSWYSYIPQYAADQLERHQSLCLRLIYPTVSSYTERLKLSRIPRINDLLRSMCCK